MTCNKRLAGSWQNPTQMRRAAVEAGHGVVVDNCALLGELQLMS